MNTTITLGDAGMILIGIGLIILIFYCINLVRNLIPVVKTMNKVLEDTDRIAAAAADGAEEAQRLMGDVKGSVSSFAQALKGNQSIIQAVTSLINSFTSLKNMLNSVKKS
jgi:uncharacterized protein YoxC